MKQSEKSIIFGGIVLLFLAAFFTISIMVQFLNYGVTKEISSFFRIGGILLSAYGYSAIFVPVFLFVSSLTLFSTGFTKKRAVILASSLLPFYTVVATERILNNILPGSTEPIFILKLITSICICGLLIAIEYLATGIAFDAIVSIKNKKNQKLKKTNYENEVSDEIQESEENINEIRIIEEVPEDRESTQVKFSENKKETSIEDESEKEEVTEEVFEEETNSLEADEFSNQEQDDEIEEVEEQQEIDVVQQDDKVEEPFIEEFIEEEQISEVQEESPIQVVFSKSKDYQEEIENEVEEITEENNEPIEEKSDFQDLYEPDSAEAEFLENPFGDDETESESENEVIQENVLDSENEEEEKTEVQEDIYKYDYNIEPEQQTEFMSEEERMNTIVPLMDIQLGDDEGEKEVEDEDTKNDEIEESNEISDYNDEELENKVTSSFDDFENIDFDNIEENDDEEQSSIPQDPLFQSAHQDFNVDESDENQDDDEEFCSEEYNDYDNDEKENDDFEVHSEKVEVVENPQVIPSVPKKQKRGAYRVPSEGLLTSYPDGEYWIIDSDTQKAAVLLKETLSEFKIEAEVTGIRKGPVITMFEILPAPGVKLSKIVALQDNIALRLAASSIRIVAPIPGKSAVGIEVPNKQRAIVSFKELIETETAAYKKMAIPVVLGKDITGEAQLLDLAKTPHLLIAGSTGSGKSVCVNSMILSILYKRSPNEVKLILIDPKVVELKLYNDIPHLLTPVITEPKKAFQAMQYCLCEMERRYALLDGMGVRDITSYNHRIEERNIATEKLPYIVVVIDEFADLMATTGKELESVVARLAAMSRAVGIHLVLATQRPSIDVITGLIKANIPTRIAFMVASKMDSRIIIDQVGAEKLLGRGDMLYASATDPFPVRIQGTFVSDNEVENVVEYVKQYGEPEYIDDEIFVEDDDDVDVGPNLFGEGEDPLYNKALEIVIQAGKASASYIQRRLKIGYNRAARLVEDMEARGIVGPANGSKPREIIHIP